MGSNRHKVQSYRAAKQDARSRKWDGWDYGVSDEIAAMFSSLGGGIDNIDVYGDQDSTYGSSPNNLVVRATASAAVNGNWKTWWIPTGRERGRRGHADYNPETYPCGHARTAENFLPNNKRSDGTFTPRCKMCIDAKALAAYRRNREKINARKRAMRAEKRMNKRAPR